MTKTAAVQAEPVDLRKYLYPTMITLIYIVWAVYMTSSNSWGLFHEYWPASLTMAFGSFVAGTTAEGGAAVAFPVFTKVLHIPSFEACIFGLMIQSFGMTMASVMIYVRIKFLPGVVTWVTLGGILGMVLGTYYLPIPNPYPKILFTFVATAFGIAVYISRWRLNLPPVEEMPVWNGRTKLMFALIGVVGGIFSANVGSGINMLAFIVLTLAYGINEKISTPTTIIIMALNSIVGFFLHAVVSQDIGIVWNYWLVAVPVVIIGAPLGAIVMGKAKRDHLLVFLLTLISIELATTLWLVPFDGEAILVTVLSLLGSAIAFIAMIRFRRTSLTNIKMGNINIH